MTISSHSWSWKLKLAIFLAISGAIVASSKESVLAQITPDTTLGNENSTVTSIGEVDSINGGATRGANLFHSFGEFNINEERAAVFTNPVGIENILTRVTGANPSNILGSLGVAGDANLFLMNPNGIIFGSNARLDIGGSFVGTTANAIGLNNREIFSANPQAPLPTGILNVNPNALLFNQIKAAAIANRSIADSRGLQVPQGKSLLLVGGDVSLNGGQIFAPGGRVELGSVAGSGTVGLNTDNSDLSLAFPDNVARADISLNNSADVNVRAGGGGSITVDARNLYLATGSQLRAGIDSELGSVEYQAGNIEINTTGIIDVTDESFIGNRVERGAIGQGGDINITTEALSISGGAQASTSTFGQGSAGNVNINARANVYLDGVSSEGFNSGIASSVGTIRAIGNGGSINIITGSLFVTNGAGITTSTRGQGNAGNVNINARGIVSFDGVSSDRAASGVLSNVVSRAIGKGGSINITTSSLLVTNGGQLQAVTKGQGDAGNITIDARDTISFDGEGESQGEFFSSAAFSTVGNGAIGNGGSMNITTSSLAVTNGALLSVTTFGQGDAGSVNINARDTVSFNGVSNSGSSSGALSTVDTEAIGKGGSINILTKSFSATNRAVLSTSSEGDGAAGNITVAARSIYLHNKALLSSDTVSGQGNIFLRSRDLILRRGSNITTDATGTAIGGNISINSDLLVAAQDSNISANADEAFGGRVIINAQGIFRTADSDITAISELGSEFNGTVELNIPDIDISQGLFYTPNVPVDTEVARTCTPSSSQARSEFVVTGRGGLPPNPTEALNTDAIAIDWVTLQPESENKYNTASSTSLTALESKPIVEAQGWIIDKDGKVVLTASAPTPTPHSSWQTLTKCSS